MPILIFLCIVIGVLFISYCINKQEKKENVTTSKQDVHNSVIIGDYLRLRVKWKSEDLGEDYDAFLFNGKEFTHVVAYDHVW